MPIKKSEEREALAREMRQIQANIDQLTEDIAGGLICRAEWEDLYAKVEMEEEDSTDTLTDDERDAVEYGSYDEYRRAYLNAGC